MLYRKLCALCMQLPRPQFSTYNTLLVLGGDAPCVIVRHCKAYAESKSAQVWPSWHKGAQLINCRATLTEKACYMFSLWCNWRQCHTIEALAQRPSLHRCECTSICIATTTQKAWFLFSELILVISVRHCSPCMKGKFVMLPRHWPSKHESICGTQDCCQPALHNSMSSMTSILQHLCVQQDR